MILLEADSRKLTILFAALLLGPAGLAESDDGTAARAVRLYDDGQYAEACPLVESQEANADGTMLYRLYYCRRLENDPRALATLEQARKKLEVEAAASAELLPAFYLANAYSNLGRPTDTRRVATDATRRFEAGKISTPKGGDEMFRLGKLYADQGFEDKAEEWYAKAVSAYAVEPSDASSPYLIWAGRYLANRAFAQQDWERALEVYGQFLSAGQGTVEDLDHMAVAAVRLERFDEAAEAWRQAVRLDPVNADRPRYCSRLSDRAAELDGLPATAPDDRPWSELSQQELHAILAETASMVAEVQREAAEPGASDLESRRKAQARVDAGKPAFVAAALEYALQGYDLREAAFSGGFAPLIFHSKRWKLPPPAPAEKKGLPNERDEETKN